MTVMFLILVGLFLTFAAFALDLGNLYLWQLRLDKAARAGALAGIGYRGLHGWAQASTSPSIIEDAATSAVRDNLKTHGLFSTISTQEDSEDSKVRIAPAYRSDTDSLTVTIEYPIPTILVGKLSNVLGFGFNSDPTQNPGNSARILTTRAHTANLNAANVVLLLDVSGSMLCPINAPCACRRTEAGCGGQATKLDQLVTGVQTFAQFFNPQRDRISVIAFNLAARRLFSFTDSFNNAQNLSSATLLDEINSTTTSPGVPVGTPAHDFFSNLATLRNGLTALAGSNTNHCDALAEGIFELENLSTALYGPPGNGDSADRRQLQPFVVLFTDGAPNAMRGIFNAQEIQQNRCSTYNNNGSRTPTLCGPSTDFYHYALEWVQGQTTGQPLTYRGPGPFVQRALRPNISSEPMLFQFPIAANSVAPPGSITCGVEQSNPILFEQTITTVIGGTPPRSQRGNPITGCLTPQNPNTFQFSIPYTNPDNNGRVGANSTAPNYQAGVSNVTISSDDWQEPDKNWPQALFTPNSGNPVPAWGYQRYDQLPYYCAIEAADYIRTRFAGTFYVIGLGPTASMLRTDLPPGQRRFCDDPLQDADDHVGRKDRFLSRLAFSRNIAPDPTTPTNVDAVYQFSLLNGKEYPGHDSRGVAGCDTHRFKINGYSSGNLTTQPRFPLTWGYTSTSPSPRVDGPNTYQDLRPFRPKVMDGLPNKTQNAGYRRLDTQGEYFPTSDPNEVPNIFGIIAKAILLRATS